MTTTVDSLVAAAGDFIQPDRFSPTRYPYTYACDFMRQFTGVIPAAILEDEGLIARIRHNHPDGWAAGAGAMSRSEASQFRQAWAAVEGRDDDDLARTLADAYLRVHNIDRGEQ